MEEVAGDGHGDLQQSAVVSDVLYLRMQRAGHYQLRGNKLSCDSIGSGRFGERTQRLLSA